MRGITIIYNNESIHTGDDLDLVQEVKKIEKPEIQSHTVKVPGRDGLLNLTKGLTGKVNYYNRKLTFEYFGTGDHARLLELDSIVSRYHGQTIRIIDDDYPNHYYEGEVEVSSEFHSNYIIIKLVVDAQPFRLKINPTIISQNINSTADITLENESIEAIPTITVTEETAIVYGDVIVMYSAGTYHDERLTLKHGSNTYTVSGNGAITIEYQEGAI